MSYKTAFDEYLNWTFDPIAMSVFQDLRCSFHKLGNHCMEYEHTRLKNEKLVCVRSDSKVLSISDLDVRLQCHMSDLKSLL